MNDDTLKRSVWWMILVVLMEVMILASFAVWSILSFCRALAAP